MGRARRVERAVRVPILGRIAYDLDLEGDILSSRPSLEKATSRRFSLSEPGRELERHSFPRQFARISARIVTTAVAAVSAKIPTCTTSPHLAT